MNKKAVYACQCRIPAHIHKTGKRCKKHKMSLIGYVFDCDECGIFVESGVRDGTTRKYCEKCAVEIHRGRVRDAYKMQQRKDYDAGRKIKPQKSVRDILGV